MVDVLRIVSGEFLQQTDPVDWWRITTGEVVKESTDSNPALQISAGERVTVTGPVSITVDCAELQVCAVGLANGNCSSLGGCVLAGEQHRVEWDETGCVDASHHIALHREIDGTGGFNEIADDLACNPGNPDIGCCNIFGGTCVPDGQFLRKENKDTSTGTTTDYQYRVRIEVDATDTLAQPGSTADTNTETDKGGNHTCFE